MTRGLIYAIPAAALFWLGCGVVLGVSMYVGFDIRWLAEIVGIFVIFLVLAWFIFSTRQRWIEMGRRLQEEDQIQRNEIQRYMEQSRNGRYIMKVQDVPPPPQE